MEPLKLTLPIDAEYSGDACSMSVTSRELPEFGITDFSRPIELTIDGTAVVVEGLLHAFRSEQPRMIEITRTDCELREHRYRECGELRVAYYWRTRPKP